jgi:subtilisin family serine protease
MVDTPNQLYTEFNLARLSGKLINFGAVDASACENSGLNADGTATECGLNAAKPLADEWQNQFNTALVAASKQENVPPRLLKNLFAWESQFWPETIFFNTFEFGLGHITLNGADSTLRWDTSLYAEICTDTFSNEYCTEEYGYQPANLRSGLQGVLVQKMNADCSGCRFNLDLEKAKKSIPLFAKALNANGSYVRYAIKVFSGREAEDMVSADDLWRFTLTSYNAGPGCYRTALSAIYYRGFDLTWANLKKYLEPACRGSIPYVEFISKTAAYHPENDPALYPTATPDGTLVAPTETPVPVSLDVPHSDDELVVKISESNLEDALKVLESMDISRDKVSEPIDESGTRVIQVEAENLGDVLAALQANPKFTSVEPNYLVDMAALPVGYPDDPQYPNQPNLTAVQVYQAWDTLSIDVNPGAPVLVAVLDTGVDSTHEDLTSRIWINPGEIACSDGIDDDHNGYVDDCSGWDMVNRDNSPSDDAINSHGTLMAGVIGAVTNNATGIAGIAPNARLMPVKVLGSNGVGTHFEAAEAIIYAANMGADVIYIGFAGAGDSQLLSNAVAYALSKGAIIVAPAGNDSGGTVNNYPASYPGVISVSAVNNSGTIAALSTRSTYISLAAPGVAVLSTARGNLYQSASGTSLAAAHVAGVFTMLAGQPQFLNQPTLLRTALLGSALDMGAAGRDPIYGYGILQANSALSFAITSATVQIDAPSSSSVFAQGQAISFGLPTSTAPLEQARLFPSLT